MSQYLFRVDILSKKDKHPLESIAYYSGEKQYDLLGEKEFYDTTTSAKVVWSKILIPEKNQQYDLFSQLPEYLKFRSQKADIISNARNILWKGVHERETRPDSQFARLFELVIPYFLIQEEAINLIHQFSQVLIQEGMITDCALHSHNQKPAVLSIIERLKLNQLPKAEQSMENTEKSQDYTGFLMCTLRDYKNGRFVNKNRAWNHPSKLPEWRSIWINMVAQAIDNCSQANEDEKSSWKNKLNIYPEYKKRTLKM